MLFGLKYTSRSCLHLSCLKSTDQGTAAHTHMVRQGLFLTHFAALSHSSHSQRGQRRWLGVALQDFGRQRKARDTHRPRVDPAELAKQSACALLLQGEGGVIFICFYYFHCRCVFCFVCRPSKFSLILLLDAQAGKDRTGIIAALVLSCTGASDLQIVNDYARCADCGCVSCLLA